MAKKQKAPEQMSIGEQVAYIQNNLGYQPMIRQPKMWLKTGSKRLNSVLGSRGFGIPYGKVILLAGDYSSGKTLLGTKILGLAQADGADPGYIDIENSADPVFAKRMGGLDFGEEIGPNIWEKVALFQPGVGIFGRTKRQPKAEVRLQTAEELFTVAEKWVMLRHRLNPKGKRAFLVDSTTAIVPEEEMVAGLDDQNMRSRLSPAVFLNTMTKRWAQIALNTNTLVILISQIRIDPTAMFGNPERIPGGKGLVFYPSIIAQLRRANKGGNITDPAGNVVGLRSTISNLKNKAGAGSVERCKIGMKAYFKKNEWQFFDAKEVKI